MTIWRTASGFYMTVAVAAALAGALLHTPTATAQNPAPTSCNCTAKGEGDECGSTNICTGTTRCPVHNCYCAQGTCQVVP